MGNLSDPDTRSFPRKLGDFSSVEYLGGMETTTITREPSTTTSTLDRGPFILVGVKATNPVEIYKGQPYEADSELLYTLKGKLEEPIVLTAAHCIAVRHPHGECTFEILPQEKTRQTEATEELECRWGRFRRDR